MLKVNWRKGTFMFSVILIASLLLSACGAKQAGTTQDGLAKELNVFNWSEYLPETVLEKFEQEFGVKVNYNTYSSNEEMLAKIAAGATGFDLAVASDYMVDIMRKQGLLETIDMSNISNIGNIGQDFMDKSFDPGNKHSVPYMWGNAVIAINTDKVKTPVTSYGDLWKPEFKNALVVLDDSRIIIGITNKVQGKPLNDTDPQVLEKSQQMLTELMANIKAFDSDSPKTMMVNGEALAGIMWGAEVALARQENPAIGVVLPSEGMELWQDNFVIPKGAPHKKTAEVFINFILRPEISAEISKAFPYANPNTAAHQFIDKEILDDPAVYPPSEELKKGEYLEDIGEATRLYDRIWSEIKR